ncbi:MAG: carboxypeptidase-like regulatory domain-containing protein, partial [Terriglobales bacterium]
MKKLLLMLVLLLLTPMAWAQGQNISGTVVNATTGQLLPRRAVTLIQLQGNMQNVAKTTTDEQGRYRFSQSGPGPYMVEADYNQVRYFAKVTAGQSETNVQVYDVSSDPSLVKVDAEIMVLQPDAGQLAVVNEYRIENAAQPPRTLNSAKGLFSFRVPPGAQVDMVRVVGPGEMPLALQAVATAQHDVYG